MTIEDTFHIEDVICQSNTSAGIRGSALTGYHGVTRDGGDPQPSYPGKLSPAGGDVEPLYSSHHDLTRGGT